MKYSKNQKCALCGQNYTNLPVTIHYSNSYHPSFCEGCGELIEQIIRLMKRMTLRSKW